MTPRWLGGRRGRAWSLLVLPVLIALALPAGAVAADGVRPPPGELPGPSDAFAHFVGDQGHVSVVEVSGDYSQLYQGEINALPRALIARELYAHHPDQYDFLVAFSTFEFDTGDAVAFHLGVRNDVQGIGLPQFDDSDLYGSAGRLQGFIDMAALRRYVTDPLAPGFEDTLAIAVHEILHQWGAYVRFRRPDGSLSDALLGRDGSHWSYLLDSDASVLYGNDWHDRGDGTFVSTGALRLLSPLDLYLAGFFSPEEVPPFLLIDNPAVDPTQLSRVGATVSGQATTVTVDDVIAAEGPRVPAASAARKDFRAAFVLLVRPGETPTSTQIAALERIRQGLETRFSVLTGGRGILEIYPEAPPGAEPGAPGELPGGPVRGTEASLVDGLAWLRAQQGVDGSWQDRPATQTRDTTLALDTLSTLDGQFIGAGGALDWIEARLASGSEITTDYLARSALALVGQGRSASDPVARLLALQNPDGGWGLGAGYASDSTDTALALGALDGAPGVPAAAVDAGAGLLLASQGPDGGWGSSAGGPGRTAITATVLQTLHRLGRESTVLPAALAFLAGKQNPDGGFGDSPSTSHDTAIALEALIATGGVGSVDGGAARAYLASHQTEEGSWEGSVYSTALALDTLKRFGYPNWRFATPLQADPAAPRDGERVSLGATVINDGNVEAPAGLVRLYDGDPDAGAAAITEAEVPPLAAGGSVVVSLTWDSLGHAGANHLVAVLDPDGATDELSELDNRASVDLDVAEAPAEADLELSDTDLNLSPAEPTELPASVAVSATVRNLGQTDVAQAVVRLLVAGPGVAPEDAIAVDEAMVAVPGRSSTPVAFTYLLEAPGTTTFVVQVDPDGAVAEADETNNQARGTVSTAAAVDLAVAPADLSLEGTPTVGSDVTFHAVFHNRGTVDSPDVPVAFTVTDGAVVRELPAATVEIAGGDAVERTVAWRVDLAGDLTFRAVIDPDGAVAETDETNNQADLAFATGGVDVPNLALAYQDLAFDPEPGREGAPVALSILVRNTGGADATGVEVGFYEGDPTQGGSLVGTLQTIPSLAAGGSATVGVTLPPLAGTGDRLIYAVADPANQIDEASEADNTAFRTLKVVSLPDLAVSPSAIESDPAFPQAGQQVTTTVTVANLGEQEADGVVVRLTVDGAPAGPDQTLPAVAPNTTGEAAFTWSYPAGATTVHLVAAVDPEDAIAEGDETNDTAERDLAAFDPTRAVSNPYVSPNGDGVQDTTVYSFTLASPADVTVEVVDSQGRTVRSHTGPELTGVVKGRFEWDGRGDDGLVVRDGTYHFRAVSSGGAVLDEALVTVDTDRWPLSAAIGTPFERVTDLTCSVEDPGSLQFVGDESEAYFLSYGGVVRVPASGPPYTLVAQSSYPGSLVVSDDGEKMAYDPEIGSDDPLAIANTDGSDRELISWANIYGLGNQAFLPGTQTLLYLGYDPYDHQVPYRLRERPLDGTGPDRSVLDYPPNNGSYITRSFSQSGLSPDGSKLVINACFRTGTTPCGLTDLQLLDVATGAYLGLPELQRDFTWSPTGKRLASVKDVDYDDLGSIPSVVIYGTDGALQHEVFLTRDLLGNLPVYDRFGPFPTDPLPYAIYTYGNSRVTWSPSGDQLAVSVEWGEVGDNYFAQYVRVYLIDATTGAIQTIGWSEPIYDFYSYHVSTWDGSQWVERTERHFGRNYSEQEVDLSQYLPDPDGEYKVRVRQTGKQAAQVDRILLRTGAPGLDGVDHRPVSARLLGPGASPEAALARVQGLDHDVLDLHENEIELRWDDPSPRATADGVKLPIRLALAAREEPDLSPRHPRPFAYPAAQGTSYQVVAGAGGAMKVDGLQTGADGLVAPLFATWSRPDTGHPAATVYGYASSDDQALYGALDFTVDNTEDGDKDWASLWVETPNGWREFRVSAVDSTWGAVGFQPTGRAAYHHKYYEFRVPLAEIGARPGDTLAVRFQAYGTAALLDPEPDLLPPEAYGLLWLPGGDTLFYYSDGSGANALIHLDQGNRVERVFDEFTTLRGAELSPSGRKLVFRDGRDIKDPQSDCYNPSFYADYSYFSFESLANDSVELKGEPTPDGRGIRLSGTATDLDFARWRLEYADEAVPEFWTPIGEAETAPVVDGDLATWLPPGPGGYLVRLTVEDLAGNRRSVVRRFSSASGSPTSITDLSESPRYISPNGDGVQDAATLHYRVLAPAHLEIGVFDEAGDRVRTFERDEGVLGTERDLVWDGRNDSGLPVPDGLYTIKVQGYAFPVTVDTVPPEALEPELRGPATLFRGVDGNDYLDVGPSVAWCASDLHPDSRGASLSIGEGADPGTWSPIAGGGVSTDCSNRGQWPSEALTLDQFVYHRFRLEARDLAGNSAVTTGPLAGEELLAYRFWDAAAGSADTGLVPVSGDVVLPQGAQARLRVAETSRSTLSRLFVQFRPACSPASGPCDPWQEDSETQLFETDTGLPATTVPEPRFDLGWDPSFLDPSTVWEIRLRSRAVDGGDLYSNVLTLRFAGGIAYHGLLQGLPSASSDPDAGPLQVALGRAGLDAQEAPVLWATEDIPDPLTDVVLFLTSEDDPRFAAGQSLPLAAVSGNVMVFDGRELLPCHTYEGAVLARVVPADGSPPSAAQSNTLSTELACLSVKGSFRALPAASCGASAGPGRDLYVTPTSYDGVELTLLTVAVDDPDNVVYSANRPQSGQVYDAPIDTTALDDGVHEVYLRLTNGEGAEAKGSEKLVVDSSPPTAQITYPVSGQRLCGLPPDATGVGGVEVQGSVEDLGAGSSWELETLSAAGDWHRAAGGTIPASLDPGAAIPKPLVSGRTDVGQRLDFPTGDVTVRLSALDDGGNRTCSEPVEFYLDGRVDGLEVSSERDLISPNGDGVADKTLLTYGAGEPVSLDVQVYHGVEHQVFFQTVVDPVGEPLRTLASGLAVAGAGTLSWDGRADDGSPVADGVYAVVFRATDGCGNTLQVSRGVGVDTTPPQVEILSPTAGAGLPLVVDVTGTATDEHFLDFQLDHGIGTTPFTWDVVARSGSQARASRLGLWNTYGLQGPQTLRLTARDRVGNSAAYLVTVDLPVEDSVITDLEATPDPVSPNGDGRRETTAIRFGFAQEVTATLAITSLDGTTTLRTLTSGETFPEGSASRPWDGRDEAGQPVADGEYRVRLEAAPTFDPSKVQTETLPITVDRAPPQIVVTRPRDGFASGQGTAQGTVDDPHLAQWVVELTDTPDQPDWREIARGETAVTGGDLGSLDGLAEGRYALRVTAEDTAENRAERIVPFEVDDTPPEVTLDAPAAGSVLGSAAGPVEVRGSAVEDHPASWRLELGAGDAPTAWTALASGDGLPPATLLSWQVGAVPDGLYTLRLTVEDLGGLTGEASAAVVVDDTPPTVAITAPPAGGYVTGPTAITGTAADANLLVYTLEVAPAGTDQWSELGRAASPVTSGTLLSWQALPPDGAYRLRLRAQDRAGNAAAADVPVTVDTHSPAPPQGLAASLEGETDARLTWQASSESDLAGYRVYRGGVLLTPQPIAALTYLDPAIPEGELPYTVTAVDRAGLESAPSEPAVLTYDRTPPTVLILDPHAGSSVSGLVEVRITATSSDFKEYRLSVGAGDGSGGRQLLRSSPTPVRSEVATEWSTLGLPEGATYTLHLEAEDVRGNVGVAEAAVVIDNQPPATPTGLAASVSGSDVSLTWNANAEPDLAGYLLYRDGRLIHGSGDDLVRRALTTTSYTDPSLPDGTFTYRLAAIDKAGNVSPLSAPATATLDLHPPHVEIVQPDVGTRFDSPLYVLATTPDQDVAEVRFEMRPAGGASWSEIATGTAAPWETTWDPAGLDYGDYEIRAVARDAGGRVDPAPTPVAVTYTDLGRPARVTGLTARVDGGDVHLTWDANTEPDLAGYYVDRTAGDGSSLRVTSTPVPGTSFTDTGLADGTYSYRVAAVDVYDNEADPSEAREARVYTPELDRPLSPTRATSVDLSGSVPASQTVTVEVSRPSGTETLPPPSVAADGRFSVAGIAVERGENQISVVAADGAGNRSKPAAARVISGVPPSAPTGLTAPVTDKQVELGWSLNPEPDVVGYREVVDGNPRFYDQFTRPTSATASSYYDDYSTPSRAVDYSTYTWWSPDPTQPVDGQWVAATWPTPQLLAAVRLNWYDSASRAVDYDVQVWDGTAWVTHTRVRGNAEATPEIDFADAYPTTGVRIVLHAIAGSETEAQSVRLADLNADTRPLVASPPDTFTLYDGLHEISVSAVNAYGFESDPSAVVDAPVGDAQGPDPVTLAATVQGSDVSLSWTESPATDLRYYLIYRDGEQIGARFDLADRTYVDPGLANGTYRYTVVGVDQVGNHGPASNEAEATVDVALPPAPVALAVTDPGLGDALDLAWSPGAGEPAAVAFRVMRSETAGGPYSAVGETAATSYRDRGLTAGTTYYYVVAGLDAVGNAGDASGEASGTPEDRTGPVAVLHFPAPPGGTFRTRETIQDLIVGTTEAGAAVEVYRDGDLVGQTTASLEASSQSVTYDAYGVPRPSPDGGRALLDDYYSLDLVDFATGDVKPVTGLSYTNAFWMPDGDRLLGAVYDYDLDKSVLTTYRLSDSSRQTLAALDSVDVAVPSPDGAEAAVLGYDGALSGLLLVDLQSGEVSSLVDGGSYDFDPDSLAWSPDGSHLAFWHDGSTGTEIEIVEIATGAVTAVPAVPGDYGYPSWSPDGASLAFTVFDSGSTYSTQLWRYRLADGVAEPITSNEEDHFLPRWSPDGASIAYVGDSERLELLDLESGQVQVLRQIADWSGDLQWAPGGHLVLLDSGQPVRVTPAGRFEVRSVPLQVGDNTFTATATDDLGNRGAISPPIVVELATDANANLTVAADDLTVLPAVSLTGQQVTFTVTVHNTGVSGSPATDLDLVLLPPSGSPLPVASGLTVTALGPAASQTFTEPFTLPTVAGRWTLVATVDPRDRVLEADEDDNRAEITFPVLSGAAPAVFVATDQSQYGA